MTILDIKTEVHQLFTAKGISSVRKLLNNKYGIYQYLVDKKLSKLLPISTEHINIFWNWHQIFSRKDSNCKEV